MNFTTQPCVYSYCIGLIFPWLSSEHLYMLFTSHHLSFFWSFVIWRRLCLSVWFPVFVTLHVCLLFAFVFLPVNMFARRACGFPLRKCLFFYVFHVNRKSHCSGSIVWDSIRSGEKRVGVAVKFTRGHIIELLVILTDYSVYIYTCLWASTGVVH